VRPEASRGNADRARKYAVCGPGGSWIDAVVAIYSRSGVARSIMAQGALRTAITSGEECIWQLVGRESLQGCDLRDAELAFADLYGADLTGSNLDGADLSGADLRDASLVNCSLRGTIFIGADLAGADLTGADTTGACFEAPRRRT
jgi:hypothetical protein